MYYYEDHILSSEKEQKTFLVECILNTVPSGTEVDPSYSKIFPNKGTK